MHVQKPYQNKKMRTSTNSIQHLRPPPKRPQISRFPSNFFKTEEDSPLAVVSNTITAFTFTGLWLLSLVTKYEVQFLTDWNVLGCPRNGLQNHS